MLVLTRKSQESVVIEGPDMLTITVLRIRGGVVRLGFEGPARIGVHRLEVWERLLAGVSPTRRPAAPSATLTAIMRSND